MKPYKFLFTFIFTQAIVAFISWAGGYNFDERNGFVALWLLVSISFGLFVSALAVMELWDGKK